MEKGDKVKLQAGDVLHGFTFQGITDLPEVPAKMWRFAYEKNGAELVWLERADDNKTFGIAFKTVPEDDTGVAHILEHSVLCGSRKYPVKEPFVDLLKSSLATFLNAMTYPDKTVYPVATRNAQDFLNLMDVYLDAVFHPLSIESDWALAQEGWHYELTADKKFADGYGPLTRNGVVYSEMKGVFANPDSVVFRETMHALFPSNTYGFESGGDPEHIPELTFEKYKAFHARFYHPSNARIFLDGDLDLDAALAKIDSFLQDYTRIDVKADIPWQVPVVTNATLSYEIGADEDEANKTILADGYVLGRYDEREKALAFAVLSDVLAGSNESPLKKALLERGLCEDLEMGGETIQQPLALVVFRNTSPDKAVEARKVFRETLEKILAAGLDHGQIEATLNHTEFMLREKDTGTYPRGIAFLEVALENWLYGGDPAEGFRYADVFAALRAKIKTGGFERYAREFFLENKHRSSLTFVPSKTLGEERRQADEKVLAAEKARWNDAQKNEVARTCKKLKEHQQSPDKPEDTAKLPMLAVKDIPVEGRPVIRTITDFEGTPIIRSKVGADGIFYLELYFALKGCTDDEIRAASFLSTLLGELDTAKHSALTLKSELDGKLGRFAVSTKSSRKGPFIVLKIGALESQQDAALQLAREVMLETKFEDVAAADNLLKQSKQEMEQSAASSGHIFAMRRASATFSAANRAAELLDGLDQLRFLQKADAKNLLAACAVLAKKVFVRERLLVCVSDNMPEAYAQKAAQLWPKGGNVCEAVAPCSAQKPPHEGFTVPGAVAYAAIANRLPEGVAFEGSHVVATRILSLDHLWNSIRVLGGAYGAGLRAASDGNVAWMTYRDPNPARSLGVFAESAQALRKFAASDFSVDKYVVSAIAKTEPYLTPRLETTRAAEMYLEDRTPEDLARTRAEILSTTKAQLVAYANELEKLVQDGGVCVIGGKDPVAACSNALDHVEAIR